MTLLLLSHVLVFSRVDVGVEFFDRRLLALLSELGDLVYILLHLVLYLLEPVLIEDASFEELMLEEADRGALAPLFDLVFRPVLLEEVSRPVWRCTVRDGLNGVGLAGLPYLLRDSVGALEDHFQVHTIDFLVLYTIGVELSREIGHGRGTGRCLSPRRRDRAGRSDRTPRSAGRSLCLHLWARARRRRPNPHRNRARRRRGASSHPCPWRDRSSCRRARPWSLWGRCLTV